MARPHLLLIGLRGSGKSTLGAQLARRTRRRFVDLDDISPGLLGRTSPAEALAEDGERAFREAETRALSRALGGPTSVIALGGGTPTAPGAEDCIRAASKKRSGVAIYLRAEPSTLRARLEATDVEDRPSLTGAGTLEEIDAVFAARDPSYRALADDIVTVDDLTPRQVIELLLSIHDRV